MKKAFVSGNFNIIHHGHLRLMKFARSIADELIIGLTEDMEDSEINTTSIDERIDNLKSISYVTKIEKINNDLTDKLKEIKPDFIIKGNEFRYKDNIETEILGQIGAELIFSSGDSTPVLQYINSEKYLKNHNIDKNKVLSIIKEYKNKRALVIGDLIVDEYINCSPIGMSQEEPIIVSKKSDSQKFIGGAGIVALHASHLGSKVDFISVIGKNDLHDNFISKNLRHQNLNLYLIKENNRKCVHKIRFKHQNKSIFRLNDFSDYDIEKKNEEKIFNLIKTNIEKYDVVIFSDFNYGLITDNLLKKITEFVKLRKKSIILTADCQSSSQIGDISKYKNMDLITPTEYEARISLHNSKDGLVVLAEKLQKEINAKNIFITLGENGLFIHTTLNKKNINDQLTPMNKNILDVSGAGDSLFTASSLALCSGANIFEAGYIGNICSAIQTSTVGNNPINIEDVIKIIQAS